MTTAKGSAPGWVKLLQSALIFSQKLAGAGVRTPTSAFDALVVGCRPRIGHLPTIASFSNPPHRVGMGTSPTPNAHAPRSVCMCNRSFRTSGDFQGKGVSAWHPQNVPVANASYDDIKDLLGGALFLPLYKWMEDSGPVYLLPTGPTTNFLVISDPQCAKNVLRDYTLYNKGLVSEVRHRRHRRRRPLRPPTAQRLRGFVGCFQVQGRVVRSRGVSC